MKKIRLMVVDDHHMVRIGLVQTLNAEEDLTVVAEAGNGLQAFEKYQQHQPDVVLTDYQMPGLDGAQLAMAIRKQFPKARIILLSAFEGEEDIWRAAKAGVMGYLPKSSEMKEVIAAIRQVASGEECFPPEILKKLKSREARKDLTPREHEVLLLIVAGKCNKEICEALEVSDGLVRLYVSRVLDQLGVKDRTQAAIKAVQSGLIHL